MKSAFLFFVVVLLAGGDALSQMWPDGMRGSMRELEGSMKAPAEGGAVLKFHLPFESGESQLGGDDITISSTTRAADCAYRGKDYGPVLGQWTGTQGPTLTETSALTNPADLYGVFSDGTEAVKFTSSQGLQESPDTTSCAVTTQDVVYEFVARFDSSMISGGSQGFLGKSAISATQYWFFMASYMPTNIVVSLWVNDGTTLSRSTVATVNYDEWNHIAVYFDRQNGMKPYLNGVGGTFQAGYASTSGSIDDNTASFKVGGISSSSSTFDLAYFKMWTGADDAWFSSTQDALALERFNKIAGWYPAKAPAGASDVTFSRASSATLSMWDGTASADSTKVHTVGANWPRVECRGEGWQDSTGRICGALVETQQDQILTDTEDASAWGLTNITSSNDVAVAPDGRTTGDEILATSTSNVHHAIGKYVSPLVQDDRGTSLYIKPGAIGVDYVFLRPGGTVSGAVYNISTCEVEDVWSSTALTTFKATVERLGASGSWCRIKLVGRSYGITLYAFPPAGVPTEASCVTNVNACSSFAASSTFDPMFYIWGVNVHESPAGYPDPKNRSASSYVKAGATTETRTGEAPSFDAASFYDETGAQTISVTFQAQPTRYSSATAFEYRNMYWLADASFSDNFVAGTLDRDFFAQPGPDSGGYQFFAGSIVDTVPYNWTVQTYPTVYDDGISHTSALYLSPGDFRGYVDSSLEASTTLYNPPGENDPIVDLYIGTSSAAFQYGSSNTIIDEFKFFEGDATP